MINRINDLNAAIDPFLAPQTVSCEELINQRLIQISSWQFNGLVLQHLQGTNIFKHVWLVDGQGNWLSIQEDSIPPELLPWKISNIAMQQIEWYTQLPNYCGPKLTYIMQFSKE